MWLGCIFFSCCFVLQLAKGPLQLFAVCVFWSLQLISESPNFSCLCSSAAVYSLVYGPPPAVIVIVINPFTRERNLGGLGHSDVPCISHTHGMSARIYGLKTWAKKKRIDFSFLSRSYFQHWHCHCHCREVPPKLIYLLPVSWIPVPVAWIPVSVAWIPMSMVVLQVCRYPRFSPSTDPVLGTKAYT